jgi:serine/threonine-protein kinase
VLILDKADRVKLQPSNPWQVETFIGSDSPIDENWTFEMANYLATEQVLNVDTVDARSDIYSLGCTFYFLLTGHPPFPGGSIAERLLKHQVATASSITEERPNAPLSLVDLCERMMSKKPEQRPQAAAEVSSALNAWLAEYDAG